MDPKRNKAGREWAVVLVDAWIDGQPTEPILRQIPEHRRGVAQAMARGTCELYRFWARGIIDGRHGIEAIPRLKGDTLIERDAIRTAVMRLVRLLEAEQAAKAQQPEAKTHVQECDSVHPPGRPAARRSGS